MSNATQAAFGFSYGFATFPWWSSLALLVTVLVYLRGWRALRRTRPQQAQSWQATCFVTGMFLVWVAIASPLDALSGVLLTAHMVQHLLLMAVAPPLVVLGAPIVPLLRGLPRALVREGLGPLFTLRVIHGVERLLASRVFAWLAMNLTFIAWHTPAAYDLALRSPGWHEVEHASFFFTSVLFWWHIIAPWPTVYAASRWLLLPFLLTSDFVNTGISAGLAFSGRVVYPVYAQAPRFFGISALSDQVAAGSLMWVMGSVSFLGAAMLITVGLLSNKERWQQVRTAAALDRGAALERLGEPAGGAFGRRLARAGRQLRAQIGSASNSGAAGARKGLDLLRLPGLGWFLRSRYGRQLLQALSFFLAAVVIVDGLLGHQVGAMNLAGIIPWTYGRGIFVLGLILCGNLFCMSCPFTLPRDAARWLMRRLGLQGLAWPRFLRNKWVPVVLVPLFFWAYEALDLWDSPERTAVLLLGYFVTAFAIDVVFRDAAFCKYVCPLGQFNFVASLASPAGVAARSASVCGECATRDCIAGHGQPAAADYQRGCELHLFQPLKQGNMDCTLCMDCVKACPHDNIGLFVQPPALDLVHLAPADPQRSGVGRYRERGDIAMLAATLTAASFASAAVMVRPVAAWMSRAGERLGPQMSVAAGVLGALLLPLLLLGIVMAAARPAQDRAQTRAQGRAWPLWVLALLPLGLSMWAAHLSFHLVTAWDTIVPGAQQALHALSRGLNWARPVPRPDWMSERPLFGPGAMLDLQLGILDIGLLTTLYTGWRMTAALQEPGRTGPTLAKRIGRLVPWTVLSAGLYALGIWILLEPMQMRGMVGM